MPLFSILGLSLLGDAIGDLSLSNYLEMRHHTGSKLFLFRKKVEGWLNSKLAERKQ